MISELEVNQVNCKFPFAEHDDQTADGVYSTGVLARNVF